MGSREAIKRARTWLEVCLSEHKGTCATPHSTKLPTRVLRIGGPQQVALHISNSEKASYICLSHCWGEKSHTLLRTTTTTLQRFQSDISWGELPNTFRDAIHVTYQLGYNFLWIDSLCIVQDSTEDWRREGSMMADIYESAIVTIAATKAPNAHSGLFAHTDSEYISHVMELNPQEFGPGKVEHAVHARKCLPHEMLHPSDDLPLLSRAWVEFRQEYQ